MAAEQISILDTTLRDGEQAPGAAMGVTKKVEIATSLMDLGVSVIEAGFPAASSGDFEAVRLIASACRSTAVGAFARTTREDIEVAGRAVECASKPRMILVIPASDLHLSLKLRQDRGQALSTLAEMIMFAKGFCDHIEIIAEDATRANIDFLCQLAKTAVQRGAQIFTVADTVGYATPEDISFYFDSLVTDVPELKSAQLGIHCHNDLGLATINSLTAVKHGARHVHCTINGLGERAGNASLEEIVLATVVRSERFPYQCGIDTTQLWSVSRLVEAATGFSVSKNKAVVGTNAYSHGSGMHQDGILKNASTYELFSPAIVGAPERMLPISRHSGRKGVRQRLKDLGLALSDGEFEDLYLKIKTQNLASGILDDRELIILTRAVTHSNKH